ncbi:uncharacterized protein TNCV_3537291 [Trichonephila clavipes]|nr:uncharacterized protein TNCV_3537291 [Trichonephila clavipes]
MGYTFMHYFTERRRRASDGAPLHWRPTKFNFYDPKERGANGFSVLPEEYFSGSENVNESLAGIDSQLRLLEIPRDLSCAYLKGHLLGRAQVWYQIFGSALVQNTATDFAQFTAALSKAFPAIRNKKDLEKVLCIPTEKGVQELTDFGCNLLNLHKKLELGMSEKALVDHIFIILEPQVQDYVEVGNPQNTVQLLGRSYPSLRKDIRTKQCWVRGIVIMLKDEVAMAGDEIVKPSTSGYNLRPRRGIKVESRPNIEMRTQKEDQFEPGKAKKITTYIEEQARSSSKRTRRSSQQQNCQKRKGGVNSNRSISLEVIVGDANYKS